MLLWLVQYTLIMLVSVFSVKLVSSRSCQNWLLLRTLFSLCNCLFDSGLGHLVAKNEDEYVQLSVDLASDITALSKLRMRLRDLMAGSPVCNGLSFAVALESAYRSMWRKYCKGEVPSLKRMEMLQREVQEDPSISKELGSSRLNVTGEATPSLKANGSAPVPSSLPTQSSQLSKRMDSTS